MRSKQNGLMVVLNGLKIILNWLKTWKYDTFKNLHKSIMNF